MSIDRFFIRDVAILTAGVIDEGYGDEPDWDTATSVSARGWLHRLDESEQDSGAPPRQADVGAWVLRLPLGTPISSSNRVTIDGTTFTVDGPPHTAYTPRGGHHLRVPLRTVEG